MSFFKDFKEDLSQAVNELMERLFGTEGFDKERYKGLWQRKYSIEKAAEEILESEEVPQGYKNYVEKYFDMIRPQ